ncbi:50S ribosomal protein L7/L12-like protein (plasmid) [Thalassoporum mexicanum PCC 7367]|uniref:hypothetical protein n=1 Tax=Thalassoporum mexicanum TaxID=3457544 RepID=UPI00029FFCA1|nr:hypothetical protein [Pseudanabaena sp. PCC 7367]AFY72013.1 50S ribosomal protein L7/L12-like protein [Pseudanabaena sp. PCC 7367]
MPRQKSAEKLEQELKKLKAKQQKISAKLSAQKRKDDTRRKILVGATIMAQVERGDFPEDVLIDILDKHLVRPRDRELFDQLDVDAKQQNLAADIKAESVAPEVITESVVPKRTRSVKSARSNKVSDKSARPARLPQSTSQDKMLEQFNLH